MLLAWEAWVGDDDGQKLRLRLELRPMKANLIIGIIFVILAAALFLASIKGVLGDGWLDKADKVASVVALLVSIVAFANPFDRGEPGPSLTRRSFDLSKNQSRQLDEGASVALTAYWTDGDIQLRVNGQPPSSKSSVGTRFIVSESSVQTCTVEYMGPQPRRRFRFDYFCSKNQ